MSMLKWSMESVWAAAAVVLTTAGSIYTTVHHGGIVDQQIVDIQTNVAKHDTQLDAINKQNAAMQQSLTDIKDTVHDIKDQVRKPQHGNHE